MIDKYFMCLFLFFRKLLSNMAAENIFNNNNLKNIDMKTCFEIFDKNHKSKLDIQNFKVLCTSLFQNKSGEKYKLDDIKIQEIFNVFDKNKDSFIDLNEFKLCWDSWITVILKPKVAILIVDVQNDFISGTLSISKCQAQHNGTDIIPPLNKLLDTVHFDTVVYSFDWHPQNHISFIENVNLRKIDPDSPVKKENVKAFDTVTFSGPPKVTQKLWPAHAVQNTWGSELHKDLKVVDNALKIYKGVNPEVDSYSAFWDNEKLSSTKLHDELQSRNTTDLYMCGLAWDYCVGHSALDALDHGYRTILIEDCIKAIDLKTADQMKNRFRNNFGIIVDSKHVADMIAGSDRHFILGYKLALTLKAVV